MLYVDLFLFYRQSVNTPQEKSIGRRGQRLQLTAMLLTLAVRYGSVPDRVYFSLVGFPADYKIE